MSSRGSAVAGNGGAGAQAIPAGSRKMVQSLKEIVNCSEAEIYATLKDCNMDPNEAVNRLLSQDPFREVKSKREKKKEVKDPTESRSRGANNSSTRGTKSTADRYVGRGGSTPYSSSDSAPPHGKAAYKKENGSTPYTSSLSSALAVSGNNRSRVHPGFSDCVSAENKTSSMETTDGLPFGIQPPSGNQSGWVGAPGQVSMADIVKMGRSHNRAVNAPNMSQSNWQGPSTTASHHSLRFADDQTSKVHESRASSVQNVPTDDEWPSIEKPVSLKVNSIPEYAVSSEVPPEASGVPLDSISQHSEDDDDEEEDEEEEEEYEEEYEEGEDDSLENAGANDVRKIPDDDARGASLFENDLYNNMGSYQPQAHNFVRHEAEEVSASVSSVAQNLQHLSVSKDERGLPSEEGDAPSVIIPNHLQVQTADCSHLSFGSFGSGISAAYSSGTMASVHAKTNLEGRHMEANVSSAAHSDARKSEYYGDDSLRNASDGSLFRGTGASVASYNASSASQPEELKTENAEGVHRNQYPFPSPSPAYSFDDVQHLNPAFSQTSSQTQNLASFPNIMSYTNSLPSTLLAANIHPNRESELQYPFPGTQSVSTKYGNSISSIGGSGISMSEALKTGGFSSTQPAPEAIPGNSAATGLPLPQHLPVHPYSQPSLPLGPLTNMIGYPFLPQSYTYMPSAFQQSFAGNNMYHQSLAAVLPQYKNSVSVSSLPQSGGVATGYGAFGNSTSIPGNFPMNPPAPSASTLSYDDVLSSQYKDNSHLLSLQQNENSAMWLHGPNSRTMSAVPTNTYYNYQGQTQQTAGGFRQGQQPSPNHGALAYPNFYPSQTGILLDQQQQNPRDGSLGGSQGQPKHSQIWQNSY